MSIKVLVLAGQREGVDSLARGENVAHKALIQVSGQSMLAHVVAALRESVAGEILVAGDDPRVVQEVERLGLRAMAPRSSPSATVLDALQSIGAPLIVTTCDHVLLQAEWINHLVAQTNSNVDVAVMLAKREQIEREIPESRRTYFHFADGDWSGCNLFLLQGERAQFVAELWQRVEKDRKQPWRIAARIGPGTLLSLLLRRLSAAQAVARVGAKVGARAICVPAPSGLAAVDVDKPEDLRQVRAYLARHSLR